jgi:5-methylcytosine-specific restriction endonuclease McrA
MDVKVKFCNNCHADTERYADGRCKPCTRAFNASYRASHKEKIKAIDAAYRAKNREKIRAKTASWMRAHPEKVAEWKRASHVANPDARRAYKHSRRARVLNAGGKLSHGLAEKLFKLQRGKCACGCKQPLGDDNHLDHITPLALGGTNTDDNIQLLRATCNRQKHSKHPVDFMQSRGFLL